METSFGSSTERRPADLALARSIGAALATAVVFVHLPDFFRTIVSANEGLYAVVAREVVHGNLPYITAWEAKPPLFFVLLAAAMRVTGVSLVTLHIVSLAAGFLTAYCVYRIGLAFGENGERIGVFSALLTVALEAANKGTSAEAEVFINALLAAAFAMIAPALNARTLRQRDAFIAALLAGCAIGMKVTAIPAALVAAFFALLATQATAQAALVVIAGISTPMLVSVLPYLAIGRMDAFLDANVATVLRRLSGAVAHPQLYEVARWESEAFFPVWALAPLAFLRRWSAADVRVGIMTLAWFCAAAVSLVAVREYFGYHFLLLVPPACILASWGFLRTWPSTRANRIALVIAALSLIGHGVGRYMTLADPDPEARAAILLRQRIAQHPGSLYVAQGDPALYVLTNEPIPTRYPYPQHLYASDMRTAANTDGMREVRRIFAADPHYVVLQPSPGDDANDELLAVRAQLDRHYTLRAVTSGYEIYDAIRIARP